jgi:cobalt-zinc-cadmium efflux system outer membrane protein
VNQAMKPLLAAALLALACRAAGAEDPSTAPGLPPVLTLQDALRIAREHAPDEAFARAGVALARAQVQSAGALPNPTFSFLTGWSSGCTDPGCNQPSYVTSLGDQGAVAALLTGQRGLAIDAAEQGVLGAVASHQDVLRVLDFHVKQQFVNTAVAARTARFALEEAAIAERTLGAARQRRDTGAVSDSDLARLQVLHGQIEQLADRAGQTFEQARAALARLLGFRADAATFEVDPGPSAVAIVPLALAGATLASLTEEARARRPDLAAARALLEQARAQASLQRRLVIPAFQLQAQYAQQGAHGGWFTPPTASVGLTVPLPVLYQRQGEIGQADAAILAAEALVKKAEAQVLADVSTAFSNLQSTRKSAERSQDRLVPRALDARNLVKDQYTKGSASLLDYLDAQRSLLLNQIEAFSALGDFWTAVFQVERAVGVNYVP